MDFKNTSKIISKEGLSVVYRLYLVKEGKEIYYGSSTYIDYMSELIDDYVKSNGKSGDKFSFKIEVSL